MYWVSRNPELLTYFNASEPWSRVYSTPDPRNRKPQELSEDELEIELFRLCSQARKPSFDTATAADSWLAFMDQLLMLPDDSAFKKDSLRRKIIELIDLYYDALDAPKSGKNVKVPDFLKAKSYPHYMERGPSFTYHSASILGQIYDRIEESKTEILPTKEILKLPSFDVDIPEKYLSMWKDRYDEYRMDMTRALKSGGESKNAAADEVIRKYKQLLYDAPDIEESAKKTEDIEMEALAIYRVTYDFARRRNDIGKCKFAWSVAGIALCNLHSRKMAGPNERPLVILSSLLRDILK
ncbi:putative RNA-dependent RNA polymerase 5 [Forsythia ovata]|uniref:RNA-dependent RNA polymerase n=1 Tax=Forsythia ovata TaxID=205694 RepID=A0ABD1SJL4_9LAMI